MTIRVEVVPFPSVRCEQCLCHIGRGQRAIPCGWSMMLARTLYFCSVHCMDNFNRAPRRDSIERRYERTQARATRIYRYRDAASLVGFFHYVLL